MRTLPACAAVLLLLPVALAGGTSPREAKGQPALPVTGEAHPDLRPLDQLMLDFVAGHDVPGAALAVCYRGRLVYARGFGYADREGLVPVLPASLFRVASVSKPVTAVAILRLVEQGKLRLTDRFADLLNVARTARNGKKRDPRLWDVTVLHLLQHTGGWDRDVSFDPMFRPLVIAKELGTEPPAGPREVIDYMMDRPLDFDPGARYAYSNFGYCLLGRVIEKVTGTPYDRHVRDHVLRPLGVRDMHVGRTRLDGRLKGEVKYYDSDRKSGPSIFPADNGQPVPAPYGLWHLEAMDSHGAWVASAPDLLRFARDFDDPANSQLLKPGTIRTMFARPAGAAGAPKAKDGDPYYYGCGWSVRPAGTGLNTWHTGSLQGTSTLLVRRHDGIDWAVLFNSRKGRDGRNLATLIDPLVHDAVNAVKRWPDRDLFAATGTGGAVRGD